MSSQPQYYCYQCSNQAQVDLPAFVCKRCGGGFIQEMPPDPIPPPRDPVVSQPAISNSGPVAASTIPLIGRNNGTSVAAPSSTAPTMQNPRQPGPPSQAPTIQAFVAPAYSGLPVQSGQSSPGQPNLVRGQVTITAMPLDAVTGLPLAANPTGFRFMHPQQMSMQQQPPPGYVPYMQPVFIQHSPFGPMQQAGNPGPLPAPFNTFFQYPGPQQQQHPQQQQQIPHHHHHHHVHPHPAHQNQVNLVPQNGGGMIFMGNGMPAGPQNVPPQNNQPQVYAPAGNESMNNLLQMLTANIDDVLTAVLNQMGPQGGPPPVTQEDVDRIATAPATKEMTADKCSICLETFILGVPSKSMPCNHAFHVPCIDRWLLMHGNCPICRTHLSGAAADNEDEHAVHEVNFTYHIGPMDMQAQGIMGGGGGPGPTQGQQRFAGPQMQQGFYRAMNPAPIGTGHRTFVFSPPHFGPAPTSMQPQHQPQYAVFPGHPNFPQQPPPQQQALPRMQMGQNFGTGHLYMGGLGQNQQPTGMLVMDIQVPGYDGAPVQPNAQPFPPQQAPQMRPSMPRQTATRSARPRGTRASGGGTSQRAPAAGATLGSLVNNVAQSLFVLPATPAAGTSPAPRSVSLNPPTLAADTAAGASSAAAAGLAAARRDTSGTNSAAKLEDDLGFD